MKLTDDQLAELADRVGRAAANELAPLIEGWLSTRPPWSERVRKLHRRGETDFIVGDCAIEECDHEDECPTAKYPICLYCWGIAEKANPYFAEQVCPVDVLWPCPTIKAIA